MRVEVTNKLGKFIIDVPRRVFLNIKNENFIRCVTDIPTKYTVLCNNILKKSEYVEL